MVTRRQKRNAARIALSSVFVATILAGAALAAKKGDMKKEAAPMKAAVASDDMSSGWMDKWPDGVPSGATISGNTINGSSKESYGNIWKKVTVDVDQTPFLVYDVASTNGFWYIVAKGEKIAQGYVKIQADTNATGKNIFDFRVLTGLTGIQEVEIDLGVSSGKSDPNKGKSVTFKSIGFVAQAPGFFPGALRVSGWSSQWPDGSLTGAQASVDGASTKFVGTNAKAGYGSAKRIVSINLDKTPFLNVSPASVNGAWFLEAAGGGLAKAVKIQADTDQTSAQSYDLKKILGLAGEQSFELYVGVGSGGGETNVGKDVTFKDISFTATPAYALAAATTK